MRSQLSELNSKASEMSSDGSELRSEATELHSLAICHRSARFLLQILTILNHMARQHHRGTSGMLRFSRGLPGFCWIIGAHWQSDLGE